MSAQVVASAGMGVDSTAVLVRWLTDASSRTFSLSALTVVIAQVGDEYPDTYANTEQVLLPLLKANRVRTVQVARPALATGSRRRYVVLDDTASPTRLVRSGPVRLSGELAATGTVAQVSNRRCSLKWKGEPIDAWIADHIPVGYTHVLGFEATESRRIDRDRAIGRHGRRPDYPLQRWGWDRDVSAWFLRETTGRVFARSSCWHCPFAGSKAGRPALAARWAAHPKAAADALLLERTALALNPKMALFGAHAAWDLAVEHRIIEPLALARRRLAAGRWALYEVRRTFTAPKRAMRSVRVRAVGSRARMHTALATATGRTPVIDEYGIRRVWLRPPSEVYPRVEHLLVVAPAAVAAKQRPVFERTWQQLAGDGDAAPLCHGVG